MRGIKVALAAAFVAAGLLTLSSVGETGSAQAMAHITKGSPGKCGVGKYYSAKDKGCVNKMMM